jgi:predicted DsbA family dithiol-disulfide isomerase
MNRPLVVDVCIEFICPWCWIGKRQLDQAIKLLNTSHPQISVECRWHGVQLLPQHPAAGLSYMDFYRRRLGTLQAVSERQAQVTAAAAEAGLSLMLNDIPWMPNTALAHALFAACGALRRTATLDALLESLFCAHFCQRQNIGDERLLDDLATRCGYQVDWTGRDSASILVGAPAAVPSFTIRPGVSFAGARSSHYIYCALLQAWHNGQAAEESGDCS